MLTYTIPLMERHIRIHCPVSQDLYYASQIRKNEQRQVSFRLIELEAVQILLHLIEFQVCTTI